jgi:hypothetical protein
MVMDNINSTILERWSEEERKKEEGICMFRLK